jgi:hypothetical protein
VSDPVYQSEPEPAPDTDYVPGRLSHLVAGNQGRLLDARRTPITVTAVTPDTGAFELEIAAFEDNGARWELPLEQIGRFQFRHDAARAPVELVAELKRAIDRFDHALEISAEPSTRQATIQRIRAERDALREQFALEPPLIPDGLDSWITRREGSRELTARLHAFLSERDLLEIDRRFAERFVSNPLSGELVKGHAIVLAELGLCDYHGKLVRNPKLFDEPWSKIRRAEHLIGRLAFTQELWTSIGHTTITLYRGAAADGPLTARAPTSFVSATFSEGVAQAHFAGGPTTQTAVLWRQQVPITRVLMTFLETQAMNTRFKEAEAILIADGDNLAF